MISQAETEQGLSSVLVVVLAVVLLAGAGVFLWWQNNWSVSGPVPTAPVNLPSSPVEKEQATDQDRNEVLAKANQALLVIKDHDAKTLANIAHPQKGIRFSPYSHVDTDKDRVITREEFKNAFTDYREFNWGVSDGSGLPIRLTTSKYWDEHVYDQDFLNANEVNYDNLKQRGNTINNVEQIYKNSNTVEYYVKGTGDEADFNWASLILVLEKQSDTWFLVGLVHDQWAI